MRSDPRSPEPLFVSGLAVSDLGCTMDHLGLTPTNLQPYSSFAESCNLKAYCPDVLVCWGMGGRCPDVAHKSPGNIHTLWSRPSWLTGGCLSLSVSRLESLVAFTFYQCVGFLFMVVTLSPCIHFKVLIIWNEIWYDMTYIWLIFNKALKMTIFGIPCVDWYIYECPQETCSSLMSRIVHFCVGQHRMWWGVETFIALLLDLFRVSTSYCEKNEIKLFWCSYSIVYNKFDHRKME